jgi:hypothetical protein
MKRMIDFYSLEKQLLNSDCWPETLVGAGDSTTTCQTNHCTSRAFNLRRKNNALKRKKIKNISDN